MSSSAQAKGADIRVCDVSVSEDELTVALMDGRTIAVPLAWSPSRQRHTRAAGALGSGGRRLRHPLAGAGRGSEHGRAAGPSKRPSAFRPFGDGALRAGAGAARLGVVALAAVGERPSVTPLLSHALA